MKSHEDRNRKCLVGSIWRLRSPSHVQGGSLNIAGAEPAVATQIVNIAMMHVAAEEYF